jgi:hypothetical protein
MYVGIVLGSDETIASVISGGQKYHPVYLTLGNIHTSAKRGNKNAMAVIGFLAIPRCKFISGLDPSRLIRSKAVASKKILTHFGRSSDSSSIIQWKLSLLL